MKKCVSNLHLHLEHLLKHGLMDTTTIVFDSEGLGHGLRICVSASSRVMLILLVHTLRTTDRDKLNWRKEGIFQTETCHRAPYQSEQGLQ